MSAVSCLINAFPRAIRAFDCAEPLWMHAHLFKPKSCEHPKVFKTFRFRDNRRIDRKL